MTEAEMIARIGLWLLRKRRTPLICPNTYLFGWESDLVGLNSRLLTFEVEVKVSKGDLMRELKPTTHIKSWRKLRLEEEKPGRSRTHIMIPSEFWLAVPEGLCMPELLPHNYGLLWVKAEGKPEHAVTVVKRAKCLHKQPLPMQQLLRFARAASYRFVLHLNQKPTTLNPSENPV